METVVALADVVDCHLASFTTEYFKSLLDLLDVFNGFALGDFDDDAARVDAEPLVNQKVREIRTQNDLRPAIQENLAGSRRVFQRFDRTITRGTFQLQRQTAALGKLEHHFGIDQATPTWSPSQNLVTE